MKSGLDDFKRKLQTKCVEILRAYKNFNSNINNANPNANMNPMQQNHGPNGPPSMAPNGPGQNGNVHVDLILPEKLQDLPKLALGIMKSQAFRGGNEVSLDHRMWLFDVVSSKGNRMSQIVFRPMLMDLLNSTPQKEEIMNPSMNNLRADGVFLLNTGLQLFLWVGINARSTVLMDVFGTNNIQEVDATLQFLGREIRGNSRKSRSIWK